MARVVLIVPCYNEAVRLPVETFMAFHLSDDSLRFVLVDDGSTDATREVLQSMAARAPERMEVLSLARNGGKSEAVRQGVLHALESNAEWVGYWDADLATPLEELPRFCEVLRESPAARVVIGARVKLLGRTVERKLHRHLYGRVFVTAVSKLLALSVYDTQCGAKLFRASDDIRVAFGEPFGSRWIFDVELLVRLIAQYEQRGEELAHHVVEVPLQRWSDVAGSKITSFDALRAAGELAAIGRRYAHALRARRRRLRRRV